MIILEVSMKRKLR